MKLFLREPLITKAIKAMQIESFGQILVNNGLELTREKTSTLQVNLGLLCNQTCRHCHLDAGPDRKEIMSSETIDQVVTYARQGRFESVDITGGAPEKVLLLL